MTRRLTITISAYKTAFFHVSVSILLLLLQHVGMAATPDVVLKAGLIIKKSATIKPGIYKLPATGKDTQVITIEGNDIVIDFQGAILQGSVKPQYPDQFIGVGLLVKGHNVTIKNVIIKGYKIGLLARDCEDLHITKSDFSYNYKQRLYSTLDRQNVSDRMSYYANEQDEWLRHGAGIYLKNCQFAEVDHCTVSGGQNGLMLTGCNSGTFWNNTFSYLSGIGMGIYRSSQNKIMHNRLDWCVQDYNHGISQQGQESAGLLVYEQSSENIIAYNSATHSGNGLFLWAGQYSMDTGEGGCNDNLIYGNDFSHALANGIEMTFSRNKVIKNRLAECTQGIWGGYSFESLILGNRFSRNKNAIALEHGQENSILYNSFEEDTTGIRLWSNKTQPADWTYAQKRNTESREYIIGNNIFTQTAVPLQLAASHQLFIEQNTFSEFTSLQLDTSLTGVSFVQNNLLLFNPAILLKSPLEKPCKNGSNYLANTTSKLKSAPTLFSDSTAIEILENMLKEEAPDSIEGGQNPIVPVNHAKGRKYILVDEWGPYDFKSPVLWPRKRGPNGTWEFELLGPAGKWKVKKQKGIQLATGSGSVPGYVIATSPGDSLTDIEIELEYTGAAIITPFGESIPAGKPYTICYRNFQTPVQWTVKYFTYNKQTNPQTAYSAFQKLLATGTPFYTQKCSTLAFDSGIKMPKDSVATLAEGTFTIPKGNYQIQVTSNDGVRIWLDGKLLIDHWQAHEPGYKTAKVPMGGTHKLKVEHYQVSGYSPLVVGIKPEEDIALK
ncbi:NosD domain-containing protein [Rhodocytophaga aerolata]|uniref:NosD domain-containing protein n=1 Tax=Rhodocytophaga aerolata TaxID=455078 RepID=A0ABT8R7T2_9BACT|nr:right-handed parallel beta-helix repeat-containing protein [Rhodocytophaga aerolata]MDO1446817.1 NosD domain-containing protein [Rhodocytophaga aerolata]